MQANQQVTFFSDGSENVRKIPEYLNPKSEHILDWFHITMRITVLQQCVRGLQKPKALTIDQDAEEKAETRLERRLESVKHYLWHGNGAMALERIGDIEEVLESWDEDDEGEKKPRPDSD